MGKTLLTSNMGSNLIINPHMDLAQRATTFTNITVSGTYTLDRFKIQMNGGYDVNIDQSTDVPLDAYASYSLKLTNNTIIDQDGGGERFLTITQPIEGYNIRKLKKKGAVTVFRAKSSIPGVYSLNCSNAGGDQFLVKEFEITSANTWQEISLSIPTLPTDVGTWDFINGIGLDWSVVLSADTANRTGSSAWEITPKKAATTQANFGNTAGATFFITDIQVQEGIEASPLEELARDPSQEVLLCQRYFAGQGSTTGNGPGVHWGTLSLVTAVTAYSWRTHISFPNTLRAAGVGQVIDSSASSTLTDTGRVDVASVGITKNSWLLRNNNAALATINPQRDRYLHWKMEAEL